MARYLNSHGGIAGRQVVPIIRSIDTTGADQNGPEAACSSFTEDDGVFAVLSVFAGSTDIPACYARHHTILIGASFYAFSQDVFRRYSPYYWNVTAQDLTSQARLTARSLVARGFFGTSTKLGVFYEDSPDFEATYKNVLQPELGRLGVRIAESAAITPYEGTNSAGAVTAEIQGAVLRFKAAGIDRVIFLDKGGSIAIFYTAVAPQQNYYPRLGLVTGNQPQTVAESGGASVMKGAIGAGYAPMVDTTESQMPFPQTPAEKRCMSIMATEGQKFDRRINAAFALEFCDMAFFFQATTQGISQLNVSAWTSRAEHLSNGFLSAVTRQTTFTPHKHWGASQWRYLTYKEACACMAYEGDNHPMP